MSRIMSHRRAVAPRWRWVAVVAVAAVGAALAAASQGGTSVEPPRDVSAGAARPEDGVRLVAPEAAAARLGTLGDRAVILDVRTPSEFAASHLAGAVLVDYRAPDFRARVADLDRRVPYVVYCHSGNRSAGAVAVMRELGFADITEVAGGIVAWRAAGLPATTSGR